MSERLLELTGVCGGYGDIQVLWDVDLAVNAGNMVCLIGSNGAGKSTLLRCISGLGVWTRGRIVFAGQDMSGRSAADIVAAGLVHVPEGRRLFRGMSVRDNLLMGAYARRDGAAAVKRDLEVVYGIFARLAERTAQDASTLSGGEQQMCAIGRGIMAAPKLLMIDELSLGLAPRLVEELGEALIKINRTGVSILLVEQDVITALELASYGFVLDRGHIAIAGDTRDLMVNPQVTDAYLGATALAVS
jgi:branched-chain amino acid transport system ATP-binding protein